MWIGIEITESAIRSAAFEDNHFSLLEDIKLPKPIDYDLLAAFIAEFEEIANGKVLISIPSYWHLSERFAFSTALHHRHIKNTILLPDVFAAHLYVRHLSSLKDSVEYLYVQTFNENYSFSFLTTFKNNPAMILEGAGFGDEKELKRIANQLGFLFHGIWSDHLKIIVKDNTTIKLNIANDNFIIPQEAILEVITRYHQEILKILNYFFFRLHTKLIFHEISPDCSGYCNQFPISSVSSLIPLPWNDYSCISFFSKLVGENLIGKNGIICEKGSNNPLFCGLIEEPCGLWISPMNGSLEVLPYIDNMPKGKSFEKSSNSNILLDILTN